MNIDEKAIEAAIYSYWQKHPDPHGQYSRQECMQRAIEAYEATKSESEPAAFTKARAEMLEGWVVDEPIPMKCVCPLPYKAKHPEEHIDTCPVVVEQPVALTDYLISIWPLREDFNDPCSKARFAKYASDISALLKREIGKEITICKHGTPSTRKCLWSECANPTDIEVVEGK